MLNTYRISLLKFRISQPNPNFFPKIVFDANLDLLHHYDYNNNSCNTRCRTQQYKHERGENIIFILMIYRLNIVLVEFK